MRQAEDGPAPVESPTVSIQDVRVTCVHGAWRFEVVWADGHMVIGPKALRGGFPTALAAFRAALREAGRRALVP